MENNSKNFFKNYWFVILVGCLLVSGAIYFAYDTNKDRISVSGKEVNGKDVVYSLADKNYTADEYFDKVFNQYTGESKYGIQLIYQDLEKMVSDNAIKTTDKIKKDAKTLKENIISQFKKQVGEDKYKDEITNQLKKLGYDDFDDLEDFAITAIKRDEVVNNYIKDHKDKYFEDFKSKEPRKLSHILVRCDNPDKPSNKEKEKMKEIDKALKDGKSFKEVAKKYSDDTATAKKEGSLGISYKGTLDKNFEKAAWKLKEGQTTTKWVKSKYGMHLIKCDSTNEKEIKNELFNSSEAITTLRKDLLTKNPNFEKEIFWNKAQELKIKINKSIEKELKEFCGVK